jgi:hypothetical protein
VFAGNDVMCKKKRAECLQQLIPKHLKKHFDFVGGVDKTQLQRLAATCRGAIVASK